MSNEWFMNYLEEAKQPGEDARDELNPDEFWEYRKLMALISIAESLERVADKLGDVTGDSVLFVKNC